MKERCLNPRHDHFHLYGGRGIKICDRWLESFVVFLDDMGPKPTPVTRSTGRRKRKLRAGEFRWATMREQASEQASALEIDTAYNSSEFHFRWG